MHVSGIFGIDVKIVIGARRILTSVGPDASYSYYFTKVVPMVTGKKCTGLLTY